jgi:hypothetical protein
MKNRSWIPLTILILVIASVVWFAGGALWHKLLIMHGVH